MFFFLLFKRLKMLSDHSKKPQAFENEPQNKMNLCLHTTHALDFRYRRRYCQYLLPYQKQVCGLCVGGDMTVLFCVQKFSKNYAKIRG